jgi:ribosomal protein S18 acetylase RimI-like enzyme
MPAIDPPTHGEMESVERHLVTLPALDGATVSEDPDAGVVFVRGPGRGPDTTYAGMPRWDTETWRDRLETVRSRMRDEGAWPSLLLTDKLDTPAGLEQEIERLGWMPVAGESVMWVAHAATVPHLDPAMRIEAVRPRSLATHEQLERHVFGLAPEQADGRRAALRAALESGALRAWVVWLDDEPVAVARLSLRHGSAVLGGIGVAEAWRGRGYGTLITTIATRAAMALGNRLVWLSVHEHNDSAVSIYTQLGFQRAFTWTRWLVTEDPRRR